MGHDSWPSIMCAVHLRQFQIARLQCVVANWSCPSSEYAQSKHTRHQHNSQEMFMMHTDTARLSHMVAVCSLTALLTVLCKFNAEQNSSDAFAPLTCYCATHVLLRLADLLRMAHWVYCICRTMSSFQRHRYRTYCT